MFPSNSEYEKYSRLALKVSDENITEYMYNYFLVQRKYSSPIQFINMDKNRKNNKIKIFLIFQLKIFVYEYIEYYKFESAKSIILYFNLIDNRFEKICNNELLLHKTMNDRFYSILLKCFVYLKKDHISKISFDEVLLLNDDKFTTDVPRRRQFILFMKKLMTVYRGQGSKKDFSTELRKDKNYRTYGTQSIKIINYINDYVDKNFILRGYSNNKPLKYLRLFFKWTYVQYGYYLDVKDITESIILIYVDQVEKDTKLGEYAKTARINYVYRFFNWLKEEEKVSIALNVNKRKYRYGINEEPRMFDDREHYMMVVERLQKYEPQNDLEKLYKYLSLIVSATGLRISEARWLDYNCLLEVKDKVGVITLKTKDKTNIINKKTSILPWGIEALEKTKRLFDQRPKILVYNKKLNEYVYTLFEFKGEVIKTYNLNQFINEKIFDDIQFKDKAGNIVNYNNKKFHAFRHQKFNDVFEISGGSIKAVQNDSGHQSTKMAKRYTMQSRAKQINEISKNIEAGKIVGKGAELLKQMLQTKMLPKEYLEIAQRLNISVYYTIDYIKDHLKFLGFGFCRASKCSIAPVCEGCDYFFTDEKYINELKKRYSLNYVLAMCQVDELDKMEQYKINNLVSLKYQEKLLVELGVNQTEIKELRKGELEYD